MPNYQFICQDCADRFDVVESVAERERQRQRCPGCGSREVRQNLHGIQVRTARKS